MTHPYQPAPGYPQQQPRRTTSGLAVAALVVGILALLTCWTVVGGILLGLVAIVLGIVALSKIRKGLAGGRGMAITGIVLGALGLLLAVALIAFGLSILNSDSGQEFKDCLQQAGNDTTAQAQCQEEFQRNVQN